uniref:Ig-like domain-containing protein n=1 Tax=Cacopsylla melanoneura TaxID=428564 RepID=A0A8D8RXK3_9HEMI
MNTTIRMTSPRAWLGILIGVVFAIHKVTLLETVTDLPSLNGNELDELTLAPPSPPQFKTENSSVVMAQTGSTAFIPCLVTNLGEGTVSWIRRKDYHLLTVGPTTYTGDQRFQALHVKQENWMLQIKYVLKRDAGVYECQVSSHPPMSLFLELRVVEARAEITGSGEKYFKLGSILQLSCVILQSPDRPSYIFWYHNNRMINYDQDRGVNVTSDLEGKASVLYIPSATRDHTGNYSCVASNAEPANTYVHILNGENPAAMQHGGHGLSWLQCPPTTKLMILCVIISTILTRT